MIKKLMRDDYTKCLDVCDELRRIIIGKVYFSVEKEGVAIHINSYRKARFDIFIERFALSNFTRHELVKKVIEEYKKSIFTKYIKEENYYEENCRKY